MATAIRGKFNWDVEVQEGANNTAVSTDTDTAYLSDNMAEHIEYRQYMAGSETDTALSLGGVTNIRFVFLKADQDIDVKLGATTNDAIPVKAGFPLVLVPRTAQTAIYVSNASSAQAELEVMLAGN